MTRLLVYAGPSGAGKSTLRDSGDDAVDVVIDPDRIARDFAPAAPASVQVEAGRAALMLFEMSLAEGWSISLETTLTGNSILRRIHAASLSGSEIQLRYIALESAEIRVNRIEQQE